MRCTTVHYVKKKYPRILAHLYGVEYTEKLHVYRVHVYELQVAKLIVDN